LRVHDDQRDAAAEEEISCDQDKKGWLLNEPVPAAACGAPARSSLLTIARQRGIRIVPVGLFQAMVCFEHLLVRSGTSKSFAVVQKFHAALSLMRDLATASTASESPFEARTLKAKAQALAETSVLEEELRPSYSVTVSTGRWVGRVDSPTTASLEQALVWRERFLAAIEKGWPDFRSVWIMVLQEKRPGHSSELRTAEAESRVDKRWYRRQAMMNNPRDAAERPAKVRRLATPSMTRAPYDCVNIVKTVKVVGRPRRHLLGRKEVVFGRTRQTNRRVETQVSLVAARLGRLLRDSKRVLGSRPIKGANHLAVTQRRRHDPRTI